MKVPLIAAALGLAGTLAATAFLHTFAASGIDRLLDERLQSAGESAALFATGEVPTAAQLRQLMTANGLDAAYVIDRGLKIVSDARGEAGRPADLLRIDPERVRAAAGGHSSVAIGYQVGDLPVGSGYFPLGSGQVLALEAGESFATARVMLRRSSLGAAALGLLAALALAVVAARWTKAETERRQAAERAARAEGLTRMAAMAAHEIRNPLGVIRGTAELMRERLPAEARGLDDILGEVERLKQLTEDLLDVSSDRPLASARFAIGELVEDAARATRAIFPQVTIVTPPADALWVQGDPGRLRQVLLNLFSNAAQSDPAGTIRIQLSAHTGWVRVRVEDSGPGVPVEVRGRLFEPFVTSKAQGTGLGLAISKRLVERHGGTLQWVDSPKGATFELQLPIAPDAGS